MDNLEFSIYALQTIHASRWELFKAKWSGKKVTMKDDNVEVTLLQHNGKTYMTSYIELKEKS